MTQNVAGRDGYGTTSAWLFDSLRRGHGAVRHERGPVPTPDHRELDGVLPCAESAEDRFDILHRAAKLRHALHPTYQEWMTRDIAEALINHGHARGAACVIEAEQLCLLLGEDRRGDERVVTQASSGCFRDDAQYRNDFLRAISGQMR